MHVEARKLSFSDEVINYAGVPSLIERRTVGYGLDYAYNKDAKPSIPWEPFPLEIGQRLEHEMKVTLQQCACNEYGTGNAYIGLHRDKHIPVNGVREEPKYIVSVSTGVTRPMVFLPRNVSTGKNMPTTFAAMMKLRDAVIIDVEPGSIMIFSNAINREWKHSIPPMKGITKDRISLTYRMF
jgi:alkylated DNA repair dioxygenase AlkB